VTAQCGIAGAHLRTFQSPVIIINRSVRLFRNDDGGATEDDEEGDWL